MFQEGPYKNYEYYVKCLLLTDAEVALLPVTTVHMLPAGNVPGGGFLVPPDLRNFYMTGTFGPNECGTTTGIGDTHSSLLQQSPVTHTSTHAHVLMHLGARTSSADYTTDHPSVPLPDDIWMMATASLHTIA
jgi:hypothetical protein